ncbi:hypothetical protein BOX15_Mlig021254g1, partial [Macrostomum lignano]
AGRLRLSIRKFPVLVEQRTLKNSTEGNFMPALMHLRGAQLLLLLLLPILLTASPAAHPQATAPSPRQVLAHHPPQGPVPVSNPCPKPKPPGSEKELRDYLKCLEKYFDSEKGGWWGRR